MPHRDPIEGRIVERHEQPAEVTYHVKRPAWARALLWLFETQAGLGLLTVTVILSTWVGVELWGWWVAVAFVTFWAGFCVGYWVARRAWIDDGVVPPL